MYLVGQDTDTICVCVCSLQSLACWNTRPSRVFQGWSPRVSVSVHPVSLTRAPTLWTPSCVSSAPSTPPCVSMAPTPSSSSRWWSSSSTSSERSPSTTCCYARTCAHGAKACKLGRWNFWADFLDILFFFFLCFDSCPLHWCVCVCAQVQCEPAGGVAQRQRSDDVWSQGDSGASDPGRSAAAGEEENWWGCRGHLLHVPCSHHCSGKPYWHSLQHIKIILTSAGPALNRLITAFLHQKVPCWLSCLIKVFVGKCRLHCF